jgi:hypothetical protein
MHILQIKQATLESQYLLIKKAILSRKSMLAAMMEANLKKQTPKWSHPPSVILSVPNHVVITITKVVSQALLLHQ